MRLLSFVFTISTLIEIFESLSMSVLGVFQRFVGADVGKLVSLLSFALKQYAIPGWDVRPDAQFEHFQEPSVVA